MSTGNRGNKRLKPNSTPLPNEVVCCLCRTKIDYEKQDPRRFFKHIREVHGLWPKKPEIEDEPMPKPGRSGETGGSRSLSRSTVVRDTSPNTGKNKDICYQI